MKFLMSVFVYLVLAAILGVGILQLIQGKPWLLVVGTLGYLGLLWRLGCVQDTSH